ncbi:hypothetical protein [Riemerella columbipharyngis]|uniref:Uncharacterized protein n=1 Tax=Riemerella columbipharyngis TaxID=1071918 RepID=A0A1G7FJ77_9FLAO|nr:hypothetical protein [Riemerella columbipharyngis]SDE75927.1 hypothetical protein SAMN05421544_12323 [Riemerella columbipharyngis]
MKKENTNIETVAEDVKTALKSEYGDKLKSLLLPKDDLCEQHKEVLAVVPSRSIVSQYLRFAKENPNKAQEILIKNCLLTSKEEVLADDGMFYAAVGLLAELIPVREGKFGRL